MKNVLVAFALVFTASGPAYAASVINKDADAQTIVVTEGSTRSELAVAGGETVEFCPNGCFVTMPNGDREALTGSETIEISGGKAVIK